jgi:TolA-binding protein
MTKTNAKRGMIQFKSGLSKESFDYGFVKDANYDDGLSVYNVVAELRKKDIEHAHAHEGLTDQVKSLQLENKKLNDVITALEARITKVESQYYEALKGVITR